MTTGTEIVDEFHRNTFFYQSMADEWLAKKIDDAIHAAVAVEAAKWGKPAPCDPAPRIPKYDAKKLESDKRYATVRIKKVKSGRE